QKKIDFNYQITGLENVWFDKELTEKVLTNLIGNAVKYTPENGFIEMNASENRDWFNFTITNNGNALSEEELAHIFDRFYFGKQNRDGIGIGLSLVKELSAFAKGNITVRSPKQDEISFLLELPVSKTFFDENELENTDNRPVQRQYSNINTEIENASEELSENIDTKNTVLLVEDDPDMRLFIKSILKHDYLILEAENGEEGVQQAIQNFPSLIVSDVMMPAKS